MTDLTQSGRKDIPTICIINYKTELLTKLCLRSIRKFTRTPYQVIVVDNNSCDESLTYLRQVKWIRLIEREGKEIPSGPAMAHASAMDIGLQACETDFLISMHSDTFVYRQNWLDQLMTPFANDPLMACSGGGKLDLKPKWEIWLKKCTDYKEWWRKLNRKNLPRRDFYIRSICGAYRMEYLKELNLKFTDGFDHGMTAAQQMYYDLMAAGYHSHIIPEYDQASCIHHLAHATMVLNPEFSVRKHTEKKCKKRLQKVLESDLTKQILADNSLDR